MISSVSHFDISMILKLLDISDIGNRFIRDYLYKVQVMTFLSHIEC